MQLMTKNRVLGCVALLAALCTSASAAPAVPDGGSSLALLSVALVGLGAGFARFRGSKRS